MPAFVFSTMTFPRSPMSRATVCAASAPPCSLFDETVERATDSSCSRVSTSTTWMPAFLSWVIGFARATSSVGAMSTPAGRVARTPVTIGVCRAASNLSGACVVSW